MKELLTRALLYLPLLLLAVSAHEAAHAWAALRRGDPTARDQGRMSLLPFTHFDLWGSLGLPLMLAALEAPLLVAFAKPTPVDPGRLRRPQRDFSLVAVAGPLANLGLALLMALAGLLLFRVAGLDSPAARQLLAAGILCNVVLAWVNLLPLPGFDGLKALYAFLPESWCWRLHRTERYHLFLLLLVVWLAPLLPDRDAVDWFYGPAARLCWALYALAGTGRPDY